MMTSFVFMKRGVIRTVPALIFSFFLFLSMLVNIIKIETKLVITVNRKATIYKKSDMIESSDNSLDSGNDQPFVFFGQDFLVWVLSKHMLQTCGYLQAGRAHFPELKK